MLALLFLVSSPHLWAQQPLAITSAANDSSIETNAIDESLPIYNGRLFYGYARITNGIPYFKKLGWQTGSLRYEGYWYSNVSMIYDAVAEQLVVRHPRYLSIALFGERIQEFEIEGERFVRLYPDADQVIKEGFYRVLVSGDVTIYERHLKQIKEEIKGDELERNIETINRFFAFRDGKYYAVNKQQSLLNLLKDKRQAVQQYLRSQNVKFKKDPERAVTLMASFYNQSVR